jgi:hypothetical protein
MQSISLALRMSRGALVGCLIQPCFQGSPSLKEVQGQNVSLVNLVVAIATQPMTERRGDTDPLKSHWETQAVYWCSELRPPSSTHEVRAPLSPVYDPVPSQPTMRLLQLAQLQETINWQASMVGCQLKNPLGES